MSSNGVDIVILCRQNTANVPYTLMSGINRYTDYTARMMVLQPTFGYPTDLIYPKDREKVIQIIQNANHIHLNILDPPQFPEEIHNAIKNAMWRGATVSKHYHGTILRINPPVQDHLYSRIFVSTPDLLEFHPHAVYLPNPVPTSLFETRPEFPEETTVVHTPSSARKNSNLLHKVRYPNLYPIPPEEETLKSTEFFRTTMDYLIEKKKKPLRYEILVYRPWEEVIKFKARDASMVYDQLIIGWYGVSAIEALALGKPVVVRIDHRWRNFLGEDHPLLLADRHTFLEDMDFYTSLDHRSMKNDCRRWAKRHHHPREVARRFTETVLEG